MPVNLSKIIADFDAAVTAARDKRDRAIRKAADEGMKQADIVRATGYSRETIRQITNPEIRQDIYQRRRDAET